jgi:aminoglycoside phosphotransferase (APT) family kinase protein
MRQDPQLPFLDLAWSPLRMADVFSRRVLPALGCRQRVASAAIETMRYTPGRECVVLYSLRFGHDQSRPISALATFVNHEMGEDIYLSHHEAGAATPDGLPGQAVVLREYSCLVEFFPGDWRLPSLARAVEGGLMARLLKDLSAGAGPTPQVDVAVLQYRPHRRCLLLYVAKSPPDTSRREVIGKVFRPGATAARTFAALDALYEQAADGLVPAPLALVRELDLVLMERVGGMSLKRVIKGARRGRGVAHAMALAAETLVTLHGRQLESGELRRPEGDVKQLRAHVKQLAPLAAALAARAEELLERSASRLASLPTALPCCIHGDFKPSQLLLDGTRVRVVDLDRTCMGDPALDLGNFMAQLHKESLKHPEQADLRPLAPYFLTQYQRRAGVDGLAARARVCQSLALIRMALHRMQRVPSLAVSGQHSSLPEVLLNEAAACLAGGEQ